MSNVKRHASLHGEPDVIAKQPNNMAASVRQRLANIARDKGEDFQYVLTRYGLERLLYRLSQSSYADDFVLKGAVLFQLWSDEPHRPTRDVDLLGYGDPSTDRITQVFQEVFEQDVVDNGLRFLSETIEAVQMKDDEEYQGVRLTAQARLENAQIPIQVDIGFGDAITPAPAPVKVRYPVYLDFPEPVLNAYPRETVVAEKYQAMVYLGIANSRMKDFYDLWVLARRFEFRGGDLCHAIQATFERRGTAIPETAPLALTSEFYEDASKQTQWKAFINKGGLDAGESGLEEVMGVLAGFLMPPTDAARGTESFDLEWSPGGPWSAASD